ncbi:MAG TPA: malonyl-CoA synthase [Azospirillum sp.]|nr:malonyl-CoA synthase [Azospirillum sp.]
MSDSLLSIVLPKPDAEGKIFLELQDGSAWSYGRFFAHAGRLANVLRSLGVEPGNRVAVQVEKSVDALALYVACVRAGVVYLPLNTAYTAAEVGYFVTDAEPRLLVCRPSFRAEAEAVAKAVGASVETLGAKGDGSLLERAAEQSDSFADYAANPDDLAAILYTSGTTGRSKGAMMTRNNLAANAIALAQIWRFTPDDVLLHALPIYHTHGLFVATNVVLQAGASMLFLPRFDADDVVRLLPRATTMMGVPTFYTRLLDHPGLTPDLVRHMRLFISGSAPLLESTHAQFAARTGHRILERYGMTETGMNTSNPYEGDRIAGTVGFPLPEVEVRITDPESGAILGPDEVGVIEVRGPNVFKGYWRMPEKTAAELRADGFFITGDVGKVDTRGYVHIVGRAKDLIISGGFNVYPKEIELAIDALDGVKESAVFGVPHPDFGEAVSAAVVLEPGASLTGAEIQQALQPVLAKFKHPKQVIILPDLPRNTMGKVQKNLLRETYAGLYA